MPMDDTAPTEFKVGGSVGITTDIDRLSTSTPLPCLEQEVKKVPSAKAQETTLLSFS